MSAPEFAIAVVLAVVVGAWVMRSFSKKEPDQVDALLRDVERQAGDVAALSSDGIAFIPRGSGLALVPVGKPSDPDLVVLGNKGEAPRATENLVPGELVAARVRRGAPDHDPWRLEGLGRDGEYRAWRFETEEAVNAALALVAERIVRPTLDEDGNPVTISDAEFAEARRIEEQTEAELANEEAYMDDDPDRDR